MNVYAKLACKVGIHIVRFPPFNQVDGYGSWWLLCATKPFCSYVYTKAKPIYALCIGFTTVLYTVMMIKFVNIYT